jgi:hypothetical protein
VRRILKSGVFLVALYLLAMLLLTVWGPWQYMASRPVVQVERPLRMLEGIRDGYTIPSNAIIEDYYVYALIPVSNFFLSGYILEKQEIKVLSVTNGIAAVQMADPSIQVVVSPGEELEDGVKVRLR